MLSVKNLKKEYGKFKIDKVSFSVERGKITGLIGNNGAGKTTVLKCVIGVLHYDFGEIIIDGLMLGHHEEEYKEKIGIVFDSGYFYENLTLEEMKKIISAAYRNWDEEVYQGYLKNYKLDSKLRNRIFFIYTIFLTRIGYSSFPQKHLTIFRNAFPRNENEICFSTCAIS